MMHALSPAVRKIGALASLAAVALTLGVATISPAGAQTSPTPAVSGCPVLSLGNPNPGDLLPSGDVLISGDAYDPESMSGAGISSVDLFIGSRDAGGFSLGTAVPGDASGTDPRAWQVTVKVPQNLTGGHDFVAYATDASTGSVTSVTVPIFVGIAPTPTPTTDKNLPAVPSETTTTNCTAAPAVPAAASNSGSPAPQPLSVAHAAPFLSLGNPSAGAVLPVGDYIVQGQAYDVASSNGSGIDSVEVFLDTRESGGTEIGSGTPGTNGVANPDFFSIDAKIPTTANGDHNVVVYAHSAVTGQETVTSVPVHVGAAPTPTPRPK